MVSVTDKAKKEILRLWGIQPMGFRDVCTPTLRVSVVGGGCSGFSYKLEFELALEFPKDRVFDCGGIRIVVDQKSYLFIEGVEIDFSDGLNGAGFTYNNPKARRSCGCGTSFST